MITEDYCSYEIAKLLKEKGFNENCYTYYDDIDTSINRFDKGYHFNNTSYPWGVPYDVSKAKKYFVAPTHQMAIKWLREQGMDIIILPVLKNEYNKQKYYIWQATGKKDKASTYEAGVEAALKYYLTEMM